MITIKLRIGVCEKHKPACGIIKRYIIGFKAPWHLFIQFKYVPNCILQIYAFMKKINRTTLKIVLVSIVAPNHTSNLLYI